MTISNVCVYVWRMDLKKSRVDGTEQVEVIPIVQVKENNLNEVGDSKNGKKRDFRDRK